MIKSFKIKVNTQGYCDVKDLTREASRLIVESRVQEGQVTFFIPGSTAGLTTVEYEPGLVKDLEVFYDKIIPQDQTYHHEETWHDGNGFSHVRASLLKPSLTVPVMEGRMTLGTWQQVILVDFDNRPRQREVILQVMGETAT